MTTSIFLLCLATHQGGNITMRDGGTFRTVTACADSGRSFQRQATAQGQHSASWCKEAKR